MLDAIGAAALAGSSAGARTPEDPAKLKEVGKQFEALLIGQMMKSMRDSEGGWLGTGDESASSAMEYGQEMFAQAMAQGGGLGLAKMITEGVRKASST